VLIFISHAAANSRLAGAFAEALMAARGDVKTFVASRPGDLRADKDWLRGIERAVQDADAYVVVLTPESVLRPWVNFEFGAAWFSRRQLIFVRVQALSPDEIPLPISSRQVYALDDIDQLRAIFQALEVPLANAEELVRKLAREAAADVLTAYDEPAWEGIRLQDIFYAWAGPLLHLKDRGPVPPPAGLLDEIARRGLVPRWANLDQIPRHNERGLAQVFATDKSSWRRPVMDRCRPLMVGNPHGKGGAA